MMPAWLRKWMQSPVFTGDEEKTRLSAILDKILMVAWAVQFLGFFVYPGEILTRLLLVGVFAISAFSLQVLLHKGYYTQANIGFLGLYWLIITVMVYLDGGVITSPSILAYAILVLWTSVSLGVLPTVVMLAACLLSSLSMVVLPHSQSWNQSLFSSTPPLLVWAVQGFVLLSLAVIGGHVTNSLRNSWRQAHRELDERRNLEEELKKQHEFNTAVLETVGSLVVVLDSTGMITLWNQACVNLTGYTAAEAVGRTAWDFMLPGQQVTQAQQNFARQMEERRPFHFENKWVTRSGQVRQIEWNNNFILDANGQVRFIIDTGQDVTEKKRIETALFESEKLFHSVFEQAATAILIADSRARLVDFNQRLCDMLGYSREELLGRSINDFGYVDDIEKNRADALKLLSGMETKSIWEKRYIRKDGAILWTLSGVTLLCDDLGQPKMFIAIMEDITDRKSTEMKLTELNAGLEKRVKERTHELELINKELEAFNYSVSHDLRAPLRSMSGFAQALWEDYGKLLPEEGRGYIQRIEISTQRMEDLIDDLLKLSRLGHKPVERLKIHPAKIAALVWEELKEDVGERSIRFKVGKIPACMADPVLLKQVYTNLISNSIKYTRPRPVAEITLGSTVKDGQVILWIKDNGVGFDMQYADKLFGIFQRLHSGFEFEGMGVGLAIVQRIIFRHHGSIWAEAAPDAGASFYFTLQSND